MPCVHHIIMSFRISIDRYLCLPQNTDKSAPTGTRRMHLLFIGGLRPKLPKQHIRPPTERFFKMVKPNTDCLALSM